tara:strand:+ start:568 stop:750 length:183 start_codon:yes stop_codon:yes gene_type:complete
MVTFARAKAKSIFYQFRFKTFSKRSSETEDKRHDEELLNKKEKTSNQFLESIKSGGVWLS